MADLLGLDFRLAEPHKLYACHDFLLTHKADLFSHLVGRWRDLFNAKFDVLLYDLTSGSTPPMCPRVTSAVTVTAATNGATVHAGRSVSGLRGAAWKRRGLQDAAIVPRQDRTAVWPRPAHMGYGSRHSDGGGAGRNARASEPPVQYLVGTPTGRLSRLEKDLLTKPWQ
jgi:hypothetical protein